jgi:hypothetical protein
MKKFACPYLSSEVELSEERERHIAENHPDLLPEYGDRIGATLADPDQVRRSVRFAGVRLFEKWYDDVRGGKYLVVVVVSEAGSPRRHWIVTAYLARKLTGGESEWKRS